MNRLTTEELKDVLVDVRRAYRLIYLYQIRIMDTVRYIADTIGISVEEGYPLFTEGTPKYGWKYRHGRSSWDWLNMYMYEFYCGRLPSTNIQFAVSVQSDTGPFDGNIKEFQPSKLSSFTSPEVSKSRMLLYLGRDYWKPADFGANTANFLKKDLDRLVEEKEGNKLFLAMAFDLEVMTDADSIIGCLQTFEQFCHENGVLEFKIRRKETAEETA